MSDVTMSDFIKMTDDFDYEQTVAAISILKHKLKSEHKDKEKHISKKEKLLKEIFARADALHLSSNGEKWTREELYER